MKSDLDKQIEIYENLKRKYPFLYEREYKEAHDILLKTKGKIAIS